MDQRCEQFFESVAHTTADCQPIRKRRILLNPFLSEIDPRNDPMHIEQKKEKKKKRGAIVSVSAAGTELLRGYMALRLVVRSTCHGRNSDSPVQRFYSSRLGHRGKEALCDLLGMAVGKSGSEKAAL
jgi:hypothetical protein